MSEDIFELPRRDLREPAFRKYEKLIARACEGPISGIQPKTEYGQSAWTFILRFKDAVLGFKRYGYESRLIPRDHSLEFKLSEMSNGAVSITPKTTAKAVQPSVFSRELASTLFPDLDSGYVKGPIFFYDVSEEDIKWIKTQQFPEGPFDVACVTEPTGDGRYKIKLM